LNIFYTNQFKKDYKRIKKQNKDLIKLQDVIKKLSDGERLEQKYKDHQL
jgi:mRNA interferase YafQ